MIQYYNGLATDAGAFDGAIEVGDDPRQPPEVRSKNAYGRFLNAVNRLSYTPEGEPLRRLVEPFMVRVGTANPFTIATLMWVRPARVAAPASHT